MSNLLRIDSFSAEPSPSPTQVLVEGSLGSRLRNIKRIGPYRIRKTIGVGSSSRVMMAVHEPTGHKVAVKVVCRDKLESKVQREIEILRLFDHPHIIRLYEVIYTDLDVFMVIEYVSGGELFEHLASSGRLSEDEGRRMFQEIIAAVEYCHARRVVHRDLKPENILLDKDNHIKIADFGLSNIMRDGFFFETSCGSLNYAAPEILSGELYAGPEVDVWSCGVILYSITCGKLPFEDVNVASLFHKIKNGSFEIPSFICADAKDLLQKILVTDPVRRIGISEIRRHPFFREKLPLYLSIESPPIVDEDESEYDEEVAQNVLENGKRLGWTKKDIEKAIGLGKDLLLKPSSEFIHFDEDEWLKLRTISISYHIYLSQQKKTREQRELLPPTVQTISRNAQHDVLREARTALSKRKRWLLGFSSVESPAKLMTGLFETLKDMEFKWKIVSKYQILAIGCSSNGVYLKLKFQVFVTAKQRNSVLDVQKLFGDCCSFLDICSKLMSKMQQSD